MGKSTARRSREFRIVGPNFRGQRHCCCHEGLLQCINIRVRPHLPVTERKPAIMGTRPACRSPGQDELALARDLQDVGLAGVLDMDPRGPPAKQSRCRR